MRWVGALVPLVLAACGGGGEGGGHAGNDAAAQTDARSDVAFMGATSSGKIPLGPALDAEAVDYSPLGADALPGCCTVRLLLPDATGGEAWARVKGDLGPLAGDGVAATWSDGAWSATVCLPAGLVTKYHFELPAPADDGGAPADAGVVDAGDASAAHAVWLVNEDVTTGYDDDDNSVNLAIVNATCSADVDGGASDASSD